MARPHPPPHLGHDLIDGSPLPGQPLRVEPEVRPRVAAREPVAPATPPRPFQQCLEAPFPAPVHASRRPPYVHEAHHQVPARPARHELGAPVRRAQPHAHAVAEIHLPPCPLPCARAQRARRDLAEPLALVGAVCHAASLAPISPRGWVAPHGWVPRLPRDARTDGANAFPPEHRGGQFTTHADNWPAEGRTLGAGASSHPASKARSSHDGPSIAPRARAVPLGDPR